MADFLCRGLGADATRQDRPKHAAGGAVSNDRLNPVSLTKKPAVRPGKSCVMRSRLKALLQNQHVARQLQHVASGVRERNRCTQDAIEEDHRC
jgi:hypothetical protein